MASVKEEKIEEISEDSSPNPQPDTHSAPLLEKKSPEVEVQLFRRGQGPIAVFQSKLGGWDQDQLEVEEILERYGFKSLYAFNPSSGRAAPIRYDRRKGRSILTYRDGAVIFVDGEPKDSLIKPVTKIIVGVSIAVVLIAIFAKEGPEWFKTKFSTATLPPWILACIIIVFTRLRKRTKNVLKMIGW